MGEIFQNVLGVLFFAGILFVAILITTKEPGISLIGSIVISIGLLLIPGKKESSPTESAAAHSSSSVRTYAVDQADSKTVYLQNYREKGDTVSIRCQQAGSQVKCETVR